MFYGYIQKGLLLRRLKVIKPNQNRRKPMATIPHICSAMQTVLGLTADRIGWQTRFQQRKSKLTGSGFVQTLVFGSLSKADLSYTDLCSSALDVGIAISAQGLAQRFSSASALLCQKILEASVQQVLTAQPQTILLLARFNGVYLRDSSVVSLPAELHALWPGVGGSLGESTAVKLQVRLEYSSGQLAGPVLYAGRTHDSQSPYQEEALPAGAIRMGDLGFFSLDQFALDQQHGVYTFSRYKIGTCLYDGSGQAIDLLAWLGSQTAPQFERSIFLGQRARFACRLMVERVPQAVVEQRRRKLREYARKKQVSVSPETLALAEWTLLITDIPLTLLSVPEALVLLTVRWQIELLFKMWKSLFQIDQWRSQDPWRILTELYAKLISVVILNWILLMDGWRTPKSSFWKAALVVRRFATVLALASRDPALLEAVLCRIQSHFRHSCRLNTRRAALGTAQALLTISPVPS
ncbi:MAG: IS4 family transposase [Mycobacterium sp.]